MEELREQLNAQKQEKQLPSWYKWVIVGLCFIMVMLCLGFCSSPYSWYINYIVPYLGVPESLYSIGKSIRFITTAVVNLFFGFLVSKFGTKKLILTGLCCLIGSMLCNAFATDLSLIYVGGVLLGLGLAWTTTTIVGFVVNQWCKENKGTIMGAILASNGLGSTIATFALKPVIERTATSFKTSYIIVAITLACVAVLILFFYKDKPKKFGEPVEKPGKKKAKRGQSWTGIEFKEAIRKPYFYVALVCIFFTGMVLQSITGVATPHLQNVGLDKSFVDVTIIVHSVALITFKFLTGFMYDKWGLRKTITTCAISGVIVMVLLALVSNSALGMVYAITYSVFSSLALPLETIMLPIYANDLFGEKAYGKTLGLFVSVNTAGYALGAPLASLCKDISGSYVFSFFLGAALMTVIVIVMQFVINASKRERKRVVEKEEAERLAIEQEQEVAAN
ncbi:MAG: MFS transporter [Clostridiales bacterium]|nr:MFS transporter [Clostridiales bacterium]